VSRLSRVLAYPLLAATGESKRLLYLAEFERSQFLDALSLRELQCRRLQSLLIHAYNSCPLHRGRFDQLGVQFKDAQHSPRLDELPDLLTVLPLLTKVDIQEHRTELRSAAIADVDARPNQTGGSTGQPISFLVDRDREESRWAAMLRHDGWAGLHLGDRRAVVWGAPLDLPLQRLRAKIRRRLLAPTLWLDTGNLTKDRMVEFDRELRNFRPKVIIAYANAIVLLAQFYKSQQIKPFSPKSIITSAEVLTPEGRALVEEVFQAPIFNRYGCREVSVIASECDRHDGMHVMAEGLYVEIVRNGRPVGPGEVGDIVVTDLLNRAMPLIRYKIGDVGSWAEGTCGCGRSLPRLQSLDGRNTDFIVAADGRIVSGVFLATYVLAQRPSLGMVQLQQSRAGEVLFRISPAPQFQQEADVTYLRDATRRHLGEATTFHYEIATDLSAEPSGKYRFCNSTVNPFA
jgi:phenylacetate-CoA ligase